MKGIPVPYLRAWRVQRAISQLDLAAASGISRQIISRLENHPAQNASFDTIGRLAKALDIDAQQLAHIDPATVRFIAPALLAGKVGAA